MPGTGDRLAQALATLVGRPLAVELVRDFLKIRQDFGTRTLERASSGKFVETVVQCLQQIANAKFDQHPDVDRFLNREVEQLTTLPEGLRICAGRIARSIYTLRNKRNVAHKASLDPSVTDLAYAHHAAAWVMAEFLRNASGVSMDEAARLIERVQAPVGMLVEEIDGVRLIHGAGSTRAELLILLHSHYPDPVSLADINASLDRRDALSVKSRISELYRRKLIQGNAVSGYRLTSPGVEAAIAEIEKLRDRS